MKNIKLHWQIIICMILGTIVGILFNSSGNYENNTIYTLILLLGDIIIRILKMVIVPLIFTSIIMGISSIKDSITDRSNKMLVGAFGLVIKKRDARRGFGFCQLKVSDKGTS